MLAQSAAFCSLPAAYGPFPFFLAFFLCSPFYPLSVQSLSCGLSLLLGVPYCLEFTGKNSVIPCRILPSQPSAPSPCPAAPIQIMFAAEGMRVQLCKCFVCLLAAAGPCLCEAACTRGRHMHADQSCTSTTACRLFQTARHLQLRRGYLFHLLLLEPAGQHPAPLLTNVAFSNCPAVGIYQWP